MSQPEKKVTRRTVVGAVAGAIGGLALGAALGWSLRTQAAPPIRETVTHTVTAPVGITGIEITFACDAGHNFLPFVDAEEAERGGHYGQNQAPKIEKALGVKLSGEEVDPGTEFSIYMADLRGAGKYNIIVYFPTYNGDIMGGGWAVPLDPFIEKYMINLSDLPPVYRFLYCSWGGKTYALPYDGDFHALYYRKDIFQDKDIRSKFKEKYGRELEPPTTYDEYLRVAEFFNGWDWDKDGEEEYGTVEDFKDLTWGIFFDRFASLGGLWFDEDMNPLVPNDAAIKALGDLRKALDFMPPGTLEFGALQVFDSMTKGVTAMTLTWPDVGPRAGSGEFPVKGDQVGTALVPGYMVNGELKRFSWTGVGRVMIITVNTPENKREAAFRVMKWMWDTSVIWVPSGLNGEDPFAYSQTSPGALPHWELANPAWSRDGILDYLRAAELNYSHGYPDLYLPGAAQYTDVLSRYIMLAVTDQMKPKDAIDSVVQEWKKITKDLGEDKQKELWRQQIIEYKRAGIWPL